jgi:hypothetical protein
MILWQQHKKYKKKTKNILPPKNQKEEKKTAKQIHIPKYVKRR